MRKRKQLTITNTKSVTEMIRYLENLRDNIPKQYKQLCVELADLGINVALASAGGSDLANYVVFSKEVKSADDNGAEVIMFGRNIGQVFGQSVDAPEINPILMLEYGSGFEGAPPQSILDGQIYVGQGSFPEQTHAFDPNGWFYRDKEGRLHRSWGEPACYPMQRAYDYMVTQVDEVIRKVFTL